MAPNSGKEEGIPGPRPNENGNLTPAAKAECPLSNTGEECPGNGGGEVSVFTNLTAESEGSATEVKFPACNVKVPAPQLAPYPLVSCKIAPTGETTFNIQWVSK